MSNTNSLPVTYPLPHLLSMLTTRLTIGSAVCFSEGIYASLIVMAPKDERFFYAGTAMTFMIWAAFWRFRESKLGADIGDLCFIDFFIHSLALVCFVTGIDTTPFLFPYAAISALKLIRVYLYQTSETQQIGWGRFGPMTWLHSKYHSVCKPIAPGSRLEKEIVVALIVAAVASIIISRLPDLWRVAVTWIVPLSFEFLYGPAQLRNLTIFNNLLSTSNTRQAELEAENAMLKRGIIAKNDGSGDPKLDSFVAAYLASSAEIQDHLVFYANTVAKEFPAKPSKKE
jgi:hypothetical protein